MYNEFTIGEEVVYKGRPPTSKLFRSITEKLLDDYFNIGCTYKIKSIEMTIDGEPLFLRFESTLGYIFPIDNFEHIPEYFENKYKLI